MHKASASLVFLTILILSCLRGAIQEPEVRLDNGEFTAELNGTNIFYAVHGQGPVLMTLPNSWGLTHEGLRALYRGLEDDLTMVYFDPRGMGRSNAIETIEDLSMATIRADLNALRLHLGLKQAHVIGWSNGGFNLFFYASEYPDTIASAIVLHSAANFSEEDQKRMQEEHAELFQAYGALQTEMKEGNLQESEKDARMKSFIINEWFPYLFAEQESGKKMLKGMYENVGFSWKHSAYANTVDTANYDARSALAMITCPTLIVAGAYDMMPPDRVEEAHQMITGSKFVLFENSGHFAPVEEGEKFVRTVVDFVENLN